ncbi:MAG: MFS transporter [Pseudomonadota bacterium]
MTHAQPTHDVSPYPRSSTAWLMVGLLTVAYIFSYVDRAILGLLIEPIKRDLSLTDEQIGWLIGPAFAIFYATIGLPLGWLVDRKRRTWIVAAGVFVWSLATAVSGLARGFWHLFFARMSVGIGEATLSPAAMSMISDSFPPERRGKPVAIYVAALSLGGGIAALVGSAVLTWAKSSPLISLPIVGAVAPWQMTFFIVGLPGLLLAFCFFAIKEPARRTLAIDPSGNLQNGVSDAIKYVGQNFGTYAGFVSLACVMTIIAYSQYFMAPAFERTWGWPAEKYALVNGLVLLAAGPAAVFLSGVLSDRWSRAGIAHAPLRLVVIGYLIMLPTAILPLLMPSAELAFVILFVNTAGIGIVSAMAVTSVLAITPAQIRGQVVALYYMAISLSGLFLGPTGVGFLSTNVFGEDNVKYAIAVLPVIFGTIPLIFIPRTYRAYRAQLACIEQTQQSTSNKESVT